MRARLVPMAVVVAASLSCSSSPPSGAVVSIAPTLVVPEDLIGQIAKFNLQIYATMPGGIGCDMTSGAVTGDVAKANPIAQTSTISTMCAPGVLRCAKFPSIPYQTVPSIFSVTGFGADGTTKVALGCTQVMINQASLDVTIKLVRVVPTATCGNGTIEPTETCDDSTKACVGCQTLEELLSYGDTPNSGTTTGAAGDKTNPFFLWNAGSGSSGSDATGALVAVFKDFSGSSQQITTRLMDDTLSPPTLFGVTADESSIYLPNCVSGCTTLPPPLAPNDAKQPSAASVGGNAYVVFSSDAPQTMGDAFDIFYGGFQQTASLMALPTCPVNTPSGLMGKTNTAPSVAANGNAFFVAWQDSNGNVSGRTVTPGAGCGTRGPEADSFGSGIGSSTTGPKVAPAGTGWAVVWPNGSNIQMQLFDSSGKPSGGAKNVGSGSNPAIASDGSELAVVWAGASGIQVQRYLPDGTIPAYAMTDTKATGASAGGVNTTDNLAGAPTPAIAGGLTTLTNSGFFVVTWITTTGVQARLINGKSGVLTDGSGYLFNTIDGSANDFQVNVAAGRAPTNPTVAVGGSGSSFIAFGWEDHGSGCAASTPGKSFPGTPCFGIVARRFPAPPN